MHEPDEQMGFRVTCSRQNPKGVCCLLLSSVKSGEHRRMRSGPSSELPDESERTLACAPSCCSGAAQALWCSTVER